jgi:hypothetical protein
MSGLEKLALVKIKLNEVKETWSKVDCRTDATLGIKYGKLGLAKELLELIESEE